MGVALDPDHVEAVVERPGRIAVGDAAGDLVGGEEAEPDRKLAAEVAPPTGQDAISGCDEDAH